MSNVEAYIHGALMARVESLLLSPVVPVIYPGPEAARPDGEHIEAHHLPNQNVRRALSGKSPMIRLGILQLTLCSPLGRFERDYRERAGQIAAHFPLDHVMTQGGVGLRVTRVDVMPGLKDDTHYRTPVRVYYQGFA